MKFLNNTQRTRFKVTIFFGIGLGAIAAWAVYHQMDGAATAAITSLGGIATVYKWGETKRTSSGEKK